MDDKHVCPICGEPTSQYMGHFRKDGLCRIHGQQFKEGTLIFCEKCKQWHDNDKPCEAGEEFPGSDFLAITRRMRPLREPDRRPWCRAWPYCTP